MNGHPGLLVRMNHRYSKSSKHHLATMHHYCRAIICHYQPALSPKMANRSHCLPYVDHISTTHWIIYESYIHNDYEPFLAKLIWTFSNVCDCQLFLAVAHHSWASTWTKSWPKSCELPMTSLDWWHRYRCRGWPCFGGWSGVGQVLSYATSDDRIW